MIPASDEPALFVIKTCYVILCSVIVLFGFGGDEDV